MLKKMLLVPVVALATAPAVAALPRADRDHTVHMSCVAEYRSGTKPTEVTPIMKLTVPWMPAGSSEASTRTFVEAQFRELMLRRDSSLYKSFCITGATLADVKSGIASWNERSGAGRSKVALDPNDVFPPLFDRLYNGQRIGKPEITRARYNAVLIAPHGK